MVSALSLISKNFLQIKERIQQSCEDPTKVRILGVTKFQSLQRIQEALDLGIHLFGVNYVQEGQKLLESFKNSSLEWHFIGHIQSRKAKDLVSYHCVQSLDRIEVAQILNRRMETLGNKMNVLVEVNIGREPQKSGVLPEELEKFVSELENFKFLSIKGLMCMPPPLSSEERRPFFKQMKNFYDALSEKYQFDTLSMGTSEDYCVALQEGANLIRLGTCLFGDRPAK